MMVNRLLTVSTPAINGSVATTHNSSSVKSLLESPYVKMDSA